MSSENNVPNNSTGESSDVATIDKIVTNNDVISPDRYVFWMDDVKVLYNDENYSKFFPTYTMTRVEQLNALSRFFIYLGIILLLIDSSNEFIYIPLIGIIMCIILYNIFELDEKGKRMELLRMRRRKETMNTQGNDINYRTYQIDDDGEIVTVDIDAEESQNYKDVSFGEPLTDYDLETGYYDSNGKLQVGKYNPPVQSLKKRAEVENIKYSLDEMRIYNSSRCRRPTSDNPFMNSSEDDFNKDDIPVACNADDEDINDDIQVKFNRNMYRDIEDVFDVKNSQRQFYTVAHNIPNDMESFARWCYKFPANCKTNQERCLRYEDLRTKY